MLLENKLSINDLIEVAKSAKGSDMANCVEAIEFATKVKAEIANSVCLEFVSTTLTDKAPRVKWESAKVIGNIAHLFPNKLDEAIKNLLINSEYPQTVIRWSAAFALGEIIQLKTKLNKTLIPAIEAICKREDRDSIKKIYQN